MRINLKGIGSYDATPENAYILEYPNDFMNGLFVDLDDDYFFVPSFVPGYVEVETQALGIGIPKIEIVEYNLSEPPHLWVASALGRCVVGQFEQLLTDYHQE